MPTAFPTNPLAEPSSEHSFPGQMPPDDDLGPKKRVRRRSKVTKPRARATENIPALPKPPGNKVRVTDEFFKYWEKTDKSHPNRLLAYIYRTWPVIDRKRLGKNSNIGILSQPTDADGIYAQFGEGDYKIILSDGLGYKQVCYTLLAGFRDANNYPADIELEDLVIEDPVNKSWIERMRMKGIRFPGDDGYDTDMEERGSGNLDAVAQLTSTVERLALSQMRQQPDPRVDLESRVSATMLDNVAQASRMGNEILQQAFTRASELSPAASRGLPDPTEQLRTIADVVRAMIPAQQPTPPPQDLMPMFTLIMGATKDSALAQVEAANRRAEALERQVEEMRKMQMELLKPREEQADPFKMVERVIAVQAKLQEANPSSGEGTPAWLQAVMQFAPVGIQLISQAATAFATGMYNRSVAVTGQGQPIPLQPPMAIQAANPNSGGGGGLDQSGGMGEYIAFLQQISEPLLAHIQNPELNGADFADWIVRSHANGSMIYMSMKEQGKDALIQLLQAHEPLWTQLRQIPSKFNLFLDEFLAYSDADQEEEAEVMEEPGGVSPPEDPPLETLPPRKGGKSRAKAQEVK